MGDPTFWDSPDKAQKHISKLNGLKKKLEDIRHGYEADEFDWVYKIPK